MSKVLEFKKSNKIILKEMKEQAKKELNFLYKITGGFRYPLPPIFNEEEMESFYDGTVEW